MRKLLSRIESEPKDKNLLPVFYFFNAISDRNFVEVIKSLSNRIGYGIDYCICTFPEDLDPWEESFEGVEFANAALDLEVVVDHKTVLDYLLLASKSYLENFPEQREVVSQIIFDFAKSYDLSFDGV